MRSYSHAYHLPANTVDGSNNFGPGHFSEKFIPMMMIKALEAQPLPIYGDGTNIRDWTNGEKVVRAIVRVGDKATVGFSFNTSCRDGGTTREWAPHT